MIPVRVPVPVLIYVSIIQIKIKCNGKRIRNKFWNQQRRRDQQHPIRFTASVHDMYRYIFTQGTYGASVDRTNYFLLISRCLTSEILPGLSMSDVRNTSWSQLSRCLTSVIRHGPKMYDVSNSTMMVLECTQRRIVYGTLLAMASL